jgi:TetR/AcrR family transcriptional regulator, transcriptional repressor of bet genes
MLDGLWLRRGHSDVEISVEEAQRLLTDFTRASLGMELVEKLARQSAI